MKEQDATITEAQVNEFLEKVGARGDCPSCGRNDWFYEPDVMGIPNSVTIPARDNKRFEIPSILFLCNHCGFLRLHARVRIRSVLGLPAREASSS